MKNGIWQHYVFSVENKQSDSNCNQFGSLYFVQVSNNQNVSNSHHFKNFNRPNPWSTSSLSRHVYYILPNLGKVKSKHRSHSRGGKGDHLALHSSRPCEELKIIQRTLEFLVELDVTVLRETVGRVAHWAKQTYRLGLHQLQETMTLPTPGHTQREDTV